MTSAERKKARAELAVARRAARADELTREVKRRELQALADDVNAEAERERAEAARVPDVAKESADDDARPYVLASMRPEAVAAATDDAERERSRGSK